MAFDYTVSKSLKSISESYDDGPPFGRIVTKRYKIGETILFDVCERHANIGQIEKIYENGDVIIKQPCGRVRKRNFIYDITNGYILPLEDPEDSKALEKILKMF